MGVKHVSDSPVAHISQILAVNCLEKRIKLSPQRVKVCVG